MEAAQNAQATAEVSSDEIVVKLKAQLAESLAALKTHEAQVLAGTTAQAALQDQLASILTERGQVSPLVSPIPCAISSDF